MPEDKAELNIRGQEIIHTHPIGLRYFISVDAMVDGVTPKDGQYFDIGVYGVDEDQPTVKILRTQHKYLDHKIGKQDEIALMSKDYRLQFNAETTEAGEYIQYPSNIDHQALQYLNEVVQTFTTLGQKDGSRIYINNKVKMIARNGLWEVVEEIPKGPPPSFGAPSKDLPGGTYPQLPNQNNQSGFGASILLNAILGLKKMKNSLSSGD